MGIGAACNVLGYLVLWAAASGWGHCPELSHAEAPCMRVLELCAAKASHAPALHACMRPAAGDLGRLGGSLLMVHSPACAPTACVAHRPQLGRAHVDPLSYWSLHFMRRQRGAPVPALLPSLTAWGPKRVAAAARLLARQARAAAEPGARAAPGASSWRTGRSSRRPCSPATAARGPTPPAWSPARATSPASAAPSSASSSPAWVRRRGGQGPVG
jgi:hypothetical protein